MALYIGLMSGTSMDGVDAALTDFDGDRPLRVVAFVEMPFPAPLAKTLHAARRHADQLPLAELGKLDVEVGRTFAAAALLVLREAGVPEEQVAAIGSHGQTLYHCPAGDTHFTVQIGDPNVIAATTRITTVSDFRRMDLALGGQGAPLAPAFHAHVFAHPRRHRAVVNIGGIANVTLLPAGPNGRVSGFDTGPGNALLDEWATRHLGTAHDAGGKWAQSGKSCPALLERLLADPYFTQTPPKSTGREYFNLHWVNTGIAALETPPAPVDVQATLVQLTARSTASAIQDHAAPTEEVLVCGGGVHNEPLMHALREILAPRTVDTTATAGIAPNSVEAVMFAWLAKRRLEGKPSNLPLVTGARRAAILGGVYLPPP